MMQRQAKQGLVNLEVAMDMSKTGRERTMVALAWHARTSTVLMRTQLYGASQQ